MGYGDDVGGMDAYVGSGAGVDVRALAGAEELRESEALFRTAMVGLPGPTGGGDGGESDPILAQREPGRTFGAFAPAADGDGEEMVGATDSTSGLMTVPGGRRVPHAAVTHVGVLPTHTRRGVLTALMRRQLRDCRSRGDTVASLRASEAVIYGRFGYGMASTARTVELDLRRAVLTPEAEALVQAGPPVRMVDPAAAWGLRQTIVAGHPGVRAGAITRGDPWWSGLRARGDGGGGGDSGIGPRYLAVCGKPGAETGYVSYRPLDTATWFTSGDRTVFVDDLHAPDAASHRALVAFLLRLDLVHTVRFPWLPDDDALPWLLTDHRAARVTGVADETWLRLVDVPAALSARTYGPGEPVTIEVHDALLPENSGLYRIAPAGAERIGPSGAYGTGNSSGTAGTAGPVGAAGMGDIEDGTRGAGERPEARVRVGDLAAAYLGGTGWRRLHDAGRLAPPAAAPGRVQGDVPERLDVLFGVRTAPYAGVMF